MRRTEAIQEEIEGVLQSDKKIREEYGMPEISPVILGWIQATENMKKFLNLPLKITTY